VPDVQAILAGDIRAGALLIRRIESGDPEGAGVLRRLYPHTGKAFVIGITGAPGAGKSTLVDGLIRSFRDMGHRVGVIAVDPSSPLTGGAILGDRLRMQRHAEDPGVFIRSMASGCHRGGLSRTAREASLVLDAMGYGIILVETVGAGQGESDIAGLAHATGIVVGPGSGDGIQAVKAGLLEVGDLFIVTHGDLPGSRETEEQLKAMLAMGEPRDPDWKPRVIRTSRDNPESVNTVASAFLEHRRALAGTGALTRRRAVMERVYLRNLVTDLVMERLCRTLEVSQALEKAVSAILEGRTDPLEAAMDLTGTILGNAHTNNPLDTKESIS
jgi:LAO/AO transport system kinase